MDAGAYGIVPDRRNIIGFWVLAPFRWRKGAFLAVLLGRSVWKGGYPPFSRMAGAHNKEKYKKQRMRWKQ